MTEEKEEGVMVHVSVDQYRKLQQMIEFDESEQKEEEDRKREEKNHNFIQLYKDHMPEIRWLMNNHAFAHNLLFFILEHMDNRNALACSYTVFEDYFGKSRTTLYRAVKTLTENGFVDVMKMGSSNVYIVNENLAWTDKNTSKKYTKYDGKILVSKKENKDYEYRKRFDRLKTLRERENLK